MATESIAAESAPSHFDLKRISVGGVGRERNGENNEPKKRDRNPKESKVNDMALYKRGEIYWADFSLDDGRRFRLSLGTSDKRQAIQSEREKIQEAKDGKVTPKVLPLAKMPLKEAVAAFMVPRGGIA